MPSATETNQWKSVAVSMDIYEKLQEISHDENRSCSREVSYLVLKEHKKLYPEKYSSES